MKEVLVSADFIGNSVTGEEGAGIYINHENVTTVSNSRFIGNTAKTKGGAIFVDSDDNITLSGICETSNNSPDNIYLSSSTNLKSALLSDTSSVGLYTSWDATSSNPIITSFNSSSHFFSDKQGYTISALDNGLYYTIEEQDTTLPQKYYVGTDEYDLKQGTFSFYSYLGRNSSSVFFYSDGYFAQSSEKYNSHLATMSSCLAMASINTCFGDREYTEETAAEHITALMTSIGCSNTEYHYPQPEYFGNDEEIISTIGYAISSKTIYLGSENEKRILIPIAIRGSAYGAEWASNITLGSGNGEAVGFSDGADQVMDGINAYIEKYNIDTDKAIFWLTGHSRSAAVANLASKRLTDLYGAEDVFAYCFAVPKAGVQSQTTAGNTYTNIHNIINRSDLVPLVGTDEMGFIRYGIDVYMPSHSVGTDAYEEQKAKMLPQLAKLNPEAVFDDYFHEASVEYFCASLPNYTFGLIGYDDFIVENKYCDYTNAEDWNKFFVKQLQIRSLTDEVEDSEYNRLSPNWKGFRHYFSDYKWYLTDTDYGVKKIVNVGSLSSNQSAMYTLTFEQALANVTNLYFSLSDENREEFMASFSFDEIKEKIDLTHVWTYIVDEWDDLSVSERNGELKMLWKALAIDEIDDSIITEQQKEVLRLSFPVVLDVLLDFVSEDYDHNDQDCIGTLIYNSSNILLAHNYEVYNSWLRSYDSFYSYEYTVVPQEPTVNTASGIYKDSVTVKINEIAGVEYYYTADGTTPDVETASKYDGEIVFKADEDIPVLCYTLKIIAVMDGVSSEVSTYSYTLSSKPFILCEEQCIMVKNLDTSGFLVVSSFSGDSFCGIKIIPVTEDCEITLESTLLDTSTSDTVKVMLFESLESLSPMCELNIIKVNQSEE